MIRMTQQLSAPGRRVLSGRLSCLRSHPSVLLHVSVGPSTCTSSLRQEEEDSNFNFRPVWVSKAFVAAMLSCKLCLQWSYCSAVVCVSALRRLVLSMRCSGPFLLSLPPVLPQPTCFSFSVRSPSACVWDETREMTKHLIAENRPCLRKGSTFTSQSIWKCWTQSFSPNHYNRDAQEEVRKETVLAY